MPPVHRARLFHPLTALFSHDVAARVAGARPPARSYLPGTPRRSGGGRISESRLWPVPLQNRLLERDWRALCYAEASRSFLASAAALAC